MWGEDLLFAARGEAAADRHLFALAAMSDTSHDYTDAKVLQNWLSEAWAEPQRRLVFDLGIRNEAAPRQ